VQPYIRPVVLLVEDDEPVRELLARLLADRGLEVLAVSSGEEALDVERGRRIDLMLSDVMLPGQNGFEVARLIRQRSPQMRILFMSGYVNQNAARADEFDLDAMLLQKPFTVADLMVRVGEVFPDLLQQPVAAPR
jgi:two-component system cell cycle sensor histidine kinase/response regulator CckA